ncbi:MAG: DUF4292 domain-containing protein [Bacteroidales bacterium]
MDFRINRKIGVWACFVLLAFVSFSCKEQKDRSNKSEKGLLATEVKKTNLGVDSARIIIQSVEWKQRKFKTLSASFTLEINFLKGQTLDGQIRIISDSALWLTIGKSILEGVRIKIEADTAWILNRLSRTYTVYPLQELNIKSVLVEEGMVQSALLGEMDEILKKNACLIASYPEEWVLESAPADSSWRAEWRVTKNTFKLKNIKLTTASNLQIQMEYMPWTECYLQVFRMDKKDKKVLELRLQYSKIKWDEAVQMPFKIPSNYKQTNSFSL